MSVQNYIQSIILTISLKIDILLIYKKNDIQKDASIIVSVIIKY